MSVNGKKNIPPGDPACGKIPIASKVKSLKSKVPNQLKKVPCQELKCPTNLTSKTIRLLVRLCTNPHFVYCFSDFAECSNDRQHIIPSGGLRRFLFPKIHRDPLVPPFKSIGKTARFRRTLITGKYHQSSEYTNKTTIACSSVAREVSPSLSSY